MLIEVWSDAVCPWCYIGLKRLQKALSLRPSARPEIRWQAFELNPDLPEQGMDRREYLRAKFGDPDPFRGGHSRMAALTADLGIEYRPDLQTRMPNTRAAHRLLQSLAGDAGQTGLYERMFRANFSLGLDLGDRSVLRALALDVGMTQAAIDGAFANDALRTIVERQEAAARELGITGVPTFVFERRLGFSGAQEVDVFLQAFDRAASVAATSSDLTC